MNASTIKDIIGLERACPSRIFPERYGSVFCTVYYFFAPARAIGETPRNFLRPIIWGYVVGTGGGCVSCACVCVFVCLNCFGWTYERSQQKCIFDLDALHFILLSLVNEIGGEQRGYAIASRQP